MAEGKIVRRGVQPPVVYTSATGGSQTGSVPLTFVSGAQWRNDDGTEQVFGSYHRTNKVNVPAGCDITLNNINYTHDMVMYDSTGAFVGAFTRTRTATGFNVFPFNYQMTQTMRLPSNVTTIAFSAANINYSDANTSISAISYSTFQQLTASYSIEPADVVEYDSGGKRYRSHTFTQNGTITVTTVGTDPTVDYLIIGGGGSGGSSYGGGGGAGGYRTTNGTSGANTTAESKVTVTTQTYSVVVGAGGAVTSSSTYQGSSGFNSSALGVISLGGGGGGGTGTGNSPVIGGSGGGGGRTTPTGAAGTTNQGQSGGNHSGSGVTEAGGGGGGSQSLGGNSTGTGTGGFGGDGLANSLRTGSNETRAGGGGGGANSFESGTVGGAGGAGGGGRGAGNAQGVGTPGAINTGSGGGGGGNVGASPSHIAQPGGSGIVIIRYEIAPNV